MRPKDLDTAINGLEVYINARHDGTLYATTHDFTKFNVKPVKTLRIPLAECTEPGWSVETCPRVAKKIAEMNQ